MSDKKDTDQFEAIKNILKTADRNKFTKVPNYVFELVAILPSPAIRVMLEIIRETIGWNREYAAITRKTFCNKTGLSHVKVIEGIKTLSQLNMIKIEQTKKVRKYAIQKESLHSVRVIPQCDHIHDVQYTPCIGKETLPYTQCIGKETLPIDSDLGKETLPIRVKFLYPKNDENPLESTDSPCLNTFLKTINKYKNNLTVFKDSEEEKKECQNDTKECQNATIKEKEPEINPDQVDKGVLLGLEEVLKHIDKEPKQRRLEIIDNLIRLATEKMNWRLCGKIKNKEISDRYKEVISKLNAKMIKALNE